MIEELFRELDELRQRLDAQVPGIALARVEAITDDGYELIYRSLPFESCSTPARVASLAVGDRTGVFFQPDPGDEVVVAFVGGNIDQPIIIGSVWNDQRQPPESADTSADNNKRTFVSRCGHQLTFDDSSGGEKITLKSSGGAEIVLEDTQDGSKITIKTSGAVATSKIELDGVSWNHQHATGTGPSGPPVSISGS